MLLKFALMENAPLEMMQGNGNEGKIGFVKTASGRVIIDPNSEKARIVEAEIQKHPNALFFRSKAIEANVPNSNGDYFSVEELMRAYKTFEGVPFFTNHDNQNIENARGKIIYAEWVPEEKAVYTISFVDRDAFPHICRSIEEEYVKGVSMGSLWGEAMISMANGTQKKIKDIVEGEEVISSYGNICKVLKTYSENLKKPMYKLILEHYSGDLLFSDDHPVLIYKDGFSFVETRDIKKDDMVCIPLIYNGIFENRDRITLANNDPSNAIVKDNGQLFLVVKVQGKEEVPFDENSYDITVENDECYIADGIAVHNCSVEYSVCNICGNRAERTSDYCVHISNRKGRKFSGKARNVVTGETKEFKDQLVWEYNYGIKFIELSAVVDPACPSCLIQGIIPNNDYLSKVANLENSFRMVKEAAMEKSASKEEIEQIEGVLGTLEEFAVNLIKKRKQVEPTFAGELVEIMTKLQEWLDELVGAGYGNIKGDVPGSEDQPEGQEEAPAPEGQEQTPAPEAPATPQLPPSTNQGTVGAVPAAAATPAPMQNNTIGKVTGSPSKPQLPTKPLMPKRSFDARSVQRIADQRIETGKELMLKAASLREKFNKIGDIDMGKRRTISEKNVQREATKEVLSNSWQEKQDFFEYIKGVPSLQDNENKLSVKKSDDSFIIVAERKDGGDNEKMTWAYEDLTDEQRELIKDSPKKAAALMLETFSKTLTNQIEGVKNMTDMNKNAGATSINKNPEVITERQLDEKGLFHSRTETEADVVTQKQLDAVRKGDEKDVVTQKQLDAVRKGDEKDVVTQKQLDAVRKDSEAEVVTQKQLEDNGNRVNNEPDVVTQKQLDNISAPWARAAASNAVYKSASEHLKSVIEVMANSVISSGCTPDEVCAVSSNLVETTKNRMDLVASISETNKSSEEIDYAKRASFWNNQKLRVASTGKKEIASLIVEGLRKVASDKTINQDVLINALDVIGEGGEAINAIANRVSEKIKESEKVAKTSANIKSELRAALSGKKDQRNEERKAIVAAEDAKIQRQAERDVLSHILNKSALENSDTVVETTFAESGLVKNDPNFKKSVVAFTRGALASKNLKLAAVTNVTISGDTIQIAVQTNEGEENVEIPVGENEAPAGEEQVPEGDISGEGLENTLPETPAPAPAMASSKNVVKTAQSPMGGGVPGTPGGASASGAPEQGLPGPTPQGGDAVQALTGEGEGEEGPKEDVPMVGEQQMPWAICPECGSSDVDVTNENGDIKGKCNNSECGAEYEAMVKKEIEFKITKPSKMMSGEGTAETPEAPEAAPEVPALPVAAQTRLDKGTIQRIAHNKEKHGHVCPACGKTACKVEKEESGHAEYVCPACETKVEKDILVSASNPDVSFLRISWDVKPNLKKCAGCNEKVAKFASELKVTNLLKNAAAKADEFPMANCIERIARVHGGNTVGSFGPCKGKVLAECVCKQLQKLGFTKVRQLNKFAEVSMNKDPMDECLEDQTKNKGHEIKEATSICNCLKKKFANEMSENIYAQAFADEVAEGKIDLNAQDLVTINKLAKEEEVKVAAVEIDEEIGSDLPELKEASVEVELVKEAFFTHCFKCKKPIKECNCGEHPKDGEKEDKADKVDKKPEDKKEKEACAATVKETKVAATEEKAEKAEKAEKKCDCGKDDCEVCGEEKKQAMAMNGQRIRKANEEVLQMGNIKTAATPKFVKNIEENVEAGVPRSKAYMGKEKEADSMINKEPVDPTVPRSEAYMGKEREADSLINKPMKSPDVAQDSSYMGHEQEVQKNMPAINLDIKGTVIAKDEKNVKQAKQMKEVETIEKDVEAGVPRSDAKMGEESKADSLINTPNKGPDVPRSKAFMGEEGNADSLINKPNKGPDVPVDNAYMGHEKEVQKDMPAINDEYLKQVRQQRDGQLEKIAFAREKKATQVVSWLVANRRIPSDMDTFENAVKALAGFEIDKIASVAEKLFPEAKAVKTASSEQKIVEAGHSIPAVNMESKVAGEESFQSKLSKAFTIGSQKFDKLLSEEGEK